MKEEPQGVPERSRDVPSTGDLGPNVVCIVVGREATAEELGTFRVVIEAMDPDDPPAVVKDNTRGVQVRIFGEESDGGG